MDKLIVGKYKTKYVFQFRAIDLFSSMYALFNNILKPLYNIYYTYVVILCQNGTFHCLIVWMTGRYGKNNCSRKKACFSRLFSGYLEIYSAIRKFFTKYIIQIKVKIVPTCKITRLPGDNFKKCI